MADENTDIETSTPAPETSQGEDALVEAAVAAAPAEPEIDMGPAPLLFNKYEMTGVAVSDPGLVRYINLTPIALPHTGARHGNKPFAKHRMSVIERLVNHLMRTENWTGKKGSAYRAVKDAFAILEERAKDNPVQVFVKALENAAPREEVTRLRYGGISVPKAVDVAPARRLDVAIRRIATGAVQSSHKSKNSIAQCLANEIFLASKADLNSFAVGKKEEVERVAKSAR